jgi:hypothetical protein
MKAVWKNELVGDIHDSQVRYMLPEVKKAEQGSISPAWVMTGFKTQKRDSEKCYAYWT